jgi:hypothetical protein
MINKLEVIDTDLLSGLPTSVNLRIVIKKTAYVGDLMNLCKETKLHL